MISNKSDTLSIDKTLILSGIDIPNLNWNDYISKIYRDKSNLDQSSTSNVFLAQNPDNRSPLPKRHALDAPHISSDNLRYKKHSDYREFDAAFAAAGALGQQQEKEQ